MACTDIRWAFELAAKEAYVHHMTHENGQLLFPAWEEQSESIRKHWIDKIKAQKAPEGNCQSCVGRFCTTGDDCVTLSLDHDD